jgi:hypothetical protein
MIAGIRVAKVGKCDGGLSDVRCLPRANGVIPGNLSVIRLSGSLADSLCP